MVLFDVLYTVDEYTVYHTLHAQIHKMCTLDITHIHNPCVLKYKNDLCVCVCVCFYSIRGNNVYNVKYFLM